CRHRLRFRQPGGVRLVTPDEGGQRAFPLDEFAGASRVVDDGLDLAAVADDAFVIEQPVDVALGEARYPIEIETMKRHAEILALGKDGSPAQTRLEGLQADFLEQAAIIVDRKAPFRVVVIEELGSRRAPAAARLAIRTY